MERSLIVGRKYEQQVLGECINSTKAELIAVFGRRRIGKTYLIKNFFEGQFDFYSTGIYEGTKVEELASFALALKDASGKPVKKIKDWFEAFDLLKEYIKTLQKEKIVVFLDEMPWFDTHKSRFIKAFEWFWNSWAADQNNLKIIVCGSATTWIMSNLLGNKGGLHNRVTRKIKISPFNLNETEELLVRNGIEWDRYQIIQAYMAIGGVPFYLQKLKPGYSAAQCIDQLFFDDNAELQLEYNFLFRSLFKESAKYRQVVECIAKKLKGLTREELLKALKWEDNGYLSTVLENLCSCDFIRTYSAYGKKDRGVLYQLTDMFTLFHLHFVKGYAGGNFHYWSNLINSPSIESWSGYSFEQVCLNHLQQIKQALGIVGIQSEISSWQQQGKEDKKGAQIDLLIDRSDRIIDLCEMKFSEGEYCISSDYAEWMRERRDLFKETFKVKKAIHLILVTTWGVKQNMNANTVQKVITMDALFRKKEF